MSSEPLRTPDNLLDATRYFEDPDIAHRFMTAARWPEGVTCPYCGGKEHSFIRTQRKWACKNKSCMKRFTVKMGTIMEDSPIGLDKWLIAMWFLADCKNGISSHEISRHLKLTQKTTWFLLHRIRAAMHEGTFEKMSGEVEIDETFVGGKAKNMHKSRKAMKIRGTGTVGKAVVMGLLARNGGKGKSRVAVKVVRNNRRSSLLPEVRSRVEKGANIYTDALKSYDALDADYVHKTVDHAVAYVIGRVSTNGCENFWSLLDRSLDGTYVSVDPDHLNKYVDEQAFRFNERQDTPQGRFLKVAMNVAGKRLTWKALTEREEGSKPRRGAKHVIMMGVVYLER